MLMLVLSIPCFAQQNKAEGFSSLHAPYRIIGIKAFSPTRR